MSLCNLVSLSFRKKSMMLRLSFLATPDFHKQRERVLHSYTLLIHCALREMVFIILH